MKIPFKVDLTGKTAIVTGGSGTLCSAMAYGLAVSGAKVAIIGRNKEKLASVSEKLTKDALDEYNKNVIVKGYSCNVINKDELSAAYETIKNELGSCDIHINGAGGNQPGAITSIEMLKKEKEDSEIANARKSQHGSGDRSEKIRTYNYPQGRITDHRINYTIYNLTAFMDGDIQDCIDHLIVAENAERLKESEL